MSTKFVGDVELNVNKILGVANLVTKEELEQLRAEIRSEKKEFVRCDAGISISTQPADFAPFTHTGTCNASSLSINGTAVATLKDLEALESKLAKETCDVACKSIYDGGKLELRVNKIENVIENLQNQMKMMQTVVDGLQNQMKLIREAGQSKKNVCIMR